MRTTSAVAILSLVCAGGMHGQGRPLDWPFFGGDAQRSGWEKSDLRITKENVKDFELVLKRKLEDKTGQDSLTPPVVIGNLISYRGFKELAFVQGSSGRIWSIDSDMNRVFWEKQLASDSAGCEGGAMAIPTLTPPTNFAAQRPRTPPAGSASPGIPASPAAQPTTAPKTSVLGSTGFGAPRPAFAVSKDGKLHVLNTSTGEDLVPAIKFLPANSRASSLTIADGVLYTTTTDCGGKAGAVWSIDLNGETRQVNSFSMKAGSAAGPGGLAIGTNGIVYATGEGALYALSPKDLKLKQSIGAGAAAPVVFTYKDREMVVSPDANGRLCLLDGEYLNEPLSCTTAVGTVSGGLSSWQDTDGTRWVLAPVSGPTGSDAPNGSVVAFKLQDENGKPVLTRAWASRDMNEPQTPVITSGVVFALAAGDQAHAILYALDGITGKELYSNGDQVGTPANRNGVTIANGRVYFTTVDGTLYAFGIHLEI